jgi:RNA polymerase primary sigma factor
LGALADSGELLDASEEVRLARAIEAGRDAQARLDSGAEATAAERRRWRALAREGDDARQEFVTANLRLVVSIARHYHADGLDLDDLVQEGNIGLMRAVDRFDWRRQYRFSTYATWFVRQAVLRAVATKGRSVRVPARRVFDGWQARHVRDQLAVSLGRVPSDEEVAARMDMSVEQVHALAGALARVASLEAPIGDDVGELGDTIVDLDADDTEETVVAAISAEELADRVAALGAREAMILRLHYGLDGAVPMRLRDIGQRLGITTERVRQIEQRALLHLRREASVQQQREPQRRLVRPLVPFAVPRGQRVGAKTAC